MTRDEAIERLNIHKSTNVFVDSIAEAIDMAIEALSAEYKHCWNCKHYEPKYNVCHAPEVVKQVISKSAEEYEDYEHATLVDIKEPLKPSAETHEIRTETHGVCLISKDDAIEAVRNEYEAEFTDLPDIPRYYYEKVVGKMAHEINVLKEQLESADAVPIVYCMDCAKSVPLDEHGALWKCKAHDRTTLRHSYCSHGERSEPSK